MKIAIVSDEHFPYTGADTEVIVNTTAALGARGAQVDLVVPRLWKRRRLDEICSFYGVEPTFRLIEVTGWPLPERNLRLEKIFHGVLAPLGRVVRGADVVHSRDVLPVWLANATRIPWSFETYRRHAEEKPWLVPLLHRMGLERGLGAVAHSEASRADLVELGFAEDAVVLARPGYAPSRFEPVLERDEARERCGLPQTGSIAGYVGNIHASKGIEELVDLSARLEDVTFVVVGGSSGEVAALRAELERRGRRNVLPVGHQRPADVPPYLYACDVLLMPQIKFNLRGGWLSQKLGGRILPGTPLKLFVYLAAGRPIVAADQAINSELLRHEENALLVPPGDADATAAAIRRVLDDGRLSERLSDSARRFVAQFSWDRRAEAMLSFFERRLAARGAA